jgi:phosphonate transport system ATP-binding protein
MTDGRIVIENLRKTFPDGTVGLDGITVTLEPGQLVAILGRSGAGKSTFLRCVARLIEPTSGRVILGGVDMTAARGAALYRARGRVGFVFQQFNLVKSYTAMENVLVARMTHTSWLRATLGLWGDADRAVARRCLEEVGLGEKLHARARDLSGGQQQRVAIARAFAQEPAALFADEPTASLDPQLAVVVLELLRDYGRRHRVPVLVNVHTVDHARRYADRVIGLSHGRLVHDGPAAALADTVIDTIYGRAA